MVLWWAAYVNVKQSFTLNVTIGVHKRLQGVHKCLTLPG